MRKLLLIVTILLYATIAYSGGFGRNYSGGYWTNGGYNPCPANASCVFNNPIIFPNPSTPTPTTYSYNSITETVSNVASYTAFTQTIYDTQGRIIGQKYFQTGGGGSTNSFVWTINNYNGWANGVARLEANSNFGLRLYLQSPYVQSEIYTGGNRLLIWGSPLILSGINYPYVGLDMAFPFSTVTHPSLTTSGIGITMATNAGQGIYTLTQNNAIMNTGPIYPRNPANVAQTLTQPTIQPVYDNNLAGLSYTGWSETGSGNLSSGVLTVNLGLPYDNASAYRCSANYDGVPTTVAGFLAITKNSGSQFVITSVNSTGGTNTTDANKVQWTCIGY